MTKVDREIFVWLRGGGDHGLNILLSALGDNVFKYGLHFRMLMILSLHMFAYISL